MDATTATWLFAIITLILFLGSVASNLIAEYLKEPLESYRPIVWAFFGISAIATVVTAIGKGYEHIPVITLLIFVSTVLWLFCFRIYRKKDPTWRRMALAGTFMLPLLTLTAGEIIYYLYEKVELATSAKKHSQIIIEELTKQIALLPGLPGRDDTSASSLVTDNIFKDLSAPIERGPYDLRALLVRGQ